MIPCKPATSIAFEGDETFDRNFDIFCASHTKIIPWRLLLPIRDWIKDEDHPGDRLCHIWFCSVGFTTQQLHNQYSIREQGRVKLTLIHYRHKNDWSDQQIAYLYVELLYIIPAYITNVPSHPTMVYLSANSSHKYAATNQWEGLPLWTTCTFISLLALFNPKLTNKD